MSRFPAFEVQHVSRWERFCLLFHRVHISADDNVCTWFKIMGGRIYVIREERLR